jgi:transposase
MSRTRRKFTREFKVEAVRLVTEGGMSISQVARDLDITPNLLSRWKVKFENDIDGAFPGKGNSSGEELPRLRREVKRLRMERDFLRKAAGYFAREKE